MRERDVHGHQRVARERARRIARARARGRGSGREPKREQSVYTSRGEEPGSRREGGREPKSTCFVERRVPPPMRHEHHVPGVLHHLRYTATLQQGGSEVGERNREWWENSCTCRARWRASHRGRDATSGIVSPKPATPHAAPHRWCSCSAASPWRCDSWPRSRGLLDEAWIGPG